MTEIKGDNAKKVLSFYFNRIKKYPTLSSSVFLTVPLAVLSSNIFPPLILANVIQKLSDQDFIPGKPFDSFGNELVLYALLVLSSGVVFWRLVDLLVWKLEGKVQRDMSRMVFSHLISQSTDFHANNFGGSLVSQNSKLVNGYVRIADNTFYGLLPLLVNLVAASIILGFTSIIYSIVILVFSIVYLFVAFKVSKPVRKKGAIQARFESKQTGYLADVITNVLTVKSFAMNKYEKSVFSKITENTRLKLMELMKAHQKQMLYFSGMTSLINVASLLLAVISVVSFNANIGIVFLIFNYSATIVSQLFSFSNQGIRNYNRSIGDAFDMVNILNKPSEIKDVTSPNKLVVENGHINLRNVTFKHKGASEYIFNNLNIKIAQGEKVGLVGHSGSGKSTLVRLLLRFSDIQSGSIEIDNQDISQVTQEELRSVISYVPQEPLLFHRSIQENISYGRLGASESDVKTAAKSSHSEEFIVDLPHKYETLVGERGVKLSGGQRQRIAIARAMLKDAPILVLDEATSALDSESEQLIQDALWKLMEGKTAIVIAHRLSTIQKMDRIIVLDNGKIVEDGSHEELINKKKGKYAKLWKHQSGGFLQD